MKKRYMISVMRLPNVSDPSAIIECGEDEEIVSATPFAVPERVGVGVGVYTQILWRLPDEEGEPADGEPANGNSNGGSR